MLESQAARPQIAQLGAALALFLALGCSDGVSAGAPTGAGGSDAVGLLAGGAGMPSTGAMNGGANTAAGSGLGGALQMGGSAGASTTLGGAGGSDPGFEACGEPISAEPEPAAAPSAANANAAAKTTLKSGNFDEAGTNVLEASAAAGVQQGARGASTLWQWAASGAWLEYTVEAVEAGSYSVVVMYYSAEPGGIATLSVDGTPIGVSQLGPKDVVGEYGGVPNCCSRGHGLLAKLSAGSHKLRVTISPRSVPIDVYGLQVNFAGQELANGGKVHPLALADEVTSLPPDGVSDFYRMNYDAQKQGWPCEKSFCRVEYLVQVEQAGAYQLSVHYQKTNQQCMGMGVSLEDEQKAIFKLDQAATTTEPIALELPCGVSRISIRDPNYVDGEFCSFGASFGAVELKRVP